MKNRRYFPLFFLVVLFLLALTLYFFAERWLRALLLYLSTAVWAKYLVSKTSLAWRVASRFIAGETIADAMRTAEMLNQKGLRVTINYLGEHVSLEAEARQAKDEILRLLQAIEQNKVDANISIKPSQLGLNIDPELLYRNLHEILSCAQTMGNKIRIDMEEAETIDTTLHIYRKLRDNDGFGHHVGVVIQSYLYRTLGDIARLAHEGAWVRLCKGAYAEPPEIAFPEKEDVDANYIQLMQVMLSEEARRQGMFAAFATHDEKMIQATIDFARENQISPDAYEFQMLFGIRRELQEQLVREGHLVRVYIPYGTTWYPYFVRRLAERPANLWFFISNLLRA